MDKQEANKRLSALEAEAAKLREIINEPERLELAQGDVVEDAYGVKLLLDGGIVALSRFKGFQHWGRFMFHNDHFDAYRHNAKRLGTFDEVFVRRSEVAKLLKIKDENGDPLEVCAEDEVIFEEDGVVELVKAIKGLTRP